MERETIELVHANPTETRDLARSVPKDTPRYHLFLYKHSHEGDYLESVGMPPTTTPPRKKDAARIWSPDPGERRRCVPSPSELDSDAVNELSALSATRHSVPDDLYCLSGLKKNPVFVFLPVFIYSMPGYSCNVKERMLYSSCKSRLLEEVERNYRLEITKKVKDEG